MFTPDEHICRDCGLMGSRNNAGELVEALPNYRKTPSTGNDRPSLVPVCLMGIRDFRAEFDAEVEASDRAAHDPIIQQMARDLHVAAVNPAQDQYLAIVHVLNAPQQCREWNRYVEGTPPREYRAMLDRRWERWMMIGQALIQAGGLLLAALAIAAGGYFSLRAAQIGRDTPSVVVPAPVVNPTINVIIPTATAGAASPTAGPPQ